MDFLGRLMACDHRETLQFFFSGLSDVTSNEQVDRSSLLYNASVLAHFAATSAVSTSGVPTPTSLMDVFDRFVLDVSPRHDPLLMEMAAAHCLLLTGFFGDQMRFRYNLDWYGGLGAAFYGLAASRSREAAHTRMMSRMAEEFPFWRSRHLQLSRELRDLPYLLG
jgi:hypothetical protein